MSERQRGYVLMEVMIGGALIAIILGSLLSSVAGARQANIIAGRDVVAAQLVAAKLDMQRGRGASAATGCGSEPVVAGQQGLYSRECAATATTPNINGVALNCIEINVTVSYAVNNPSKPTRSVTGETWVCQ